MKVIAVLALVLAAGMGAEANWYKTTTTTTTPYNLTSYNLTSLAGTRSRAAAGASTGDVYSLLQQQLAAYQAYHAKLAASLLAKYKIPVASPAPAPAPRAAPVPVTPTVSGPPATAAAAGSTATETTPTTPAETTPTTASTATETPTGTAGASSQASAAPGGEAAATATATATNSVAGVAGSNPDLTTLVAAVEAAGLTSALSDPNLVATVLAPTNEAFAALLSKLGLTAAEALANTDLLKIVLSYHVIPGVAAKAADLTDGQQLPTQDADQTITVQKNEQGITFVPSAPGATPAKVVAADIPAGAAIVHVIDQVLVPANALPASAAAAPTAEAPVESVAAAGRKMKL